MTRRLITDADEWRHAITDGFTRFEFELEPMGRTRITVGEYYNREFEPQNGGSFDADRIDELGDALKAFAAHSRGDKS